MKDRTPGRGCVRGTLTLRVFWLSRRNNWDVIVFSPEARDGTTSLSPVPSPSDRGPLSYEVISELSSLRWRTHSRCLLALHLSEGIFGTGTRSSAVSPPLFFFFFVSIWLVSDPPSLDSKPYLKVLRSFTFQYSSLIGFRLQNLHSMFTLRGSRRQCLKFRRWQLVKSETKEPNGCSWVYLWICKKVVLLYYRDEVLLLWWLG